jgi:hypothetical protein
MEAFINLIAKIGRTSCLFQIRYKKHIQAIRNNRESSGYAQHILKTGHIYGLIDDTIETIKVARKGKYLDSLEKYYIYCTYKEK